MITSALGLGAHIFLKFGDLLRGEADDRLLPHRVDVGSARAVNLQAAGDMNERKPCFKLSGHLRGAQDGVAAVRPQVNRAKNAANGELTA